MEPAFLEWLSGFTDAEGNFNITLRKFNGNTYSSVMLTFQICLHIDDLFLLENIKKQLNCGHISISGSKCNFFINDKPSLVQVVLPIFNYIKLNSSKYYQFLIFEKAVNLYKDNKHLSTEGKLEMISLYKQIKLSYLAPSSKIFNNAPLTLNWLGGFTDGDSTFSISNYKPRLKFENHIKELELFKRIKSYLNSNTNIIITKPRINRPNANITITLDITNIQFLKNHISNLYSKPGILKSKKLKDFNDWSIVVNLYYLGYHLKPEGQLLIKEIKNRLNNFRLSTNIKNITSSLEIPNNKSSFDSLSFENRLKIILLTPSPYEILNGVRVKRGTHKLVSDRVKIICIDNLKNKTIYSSITECSLKLGLDRAKIKTCLITGEEYKNYQFIFAPLP
uniref:LAGLIDADG homing endonuclease n=1 Tax=Cyathus stercoreus TaxID=181520 RepID=UPI002551E6B6|nr:LAGLIDADG homing endonuclease [Cyathus stercoreus]WEV87344.1 LAGLIDADG homing endonuclease [Cyathus stercoreus]